MGHTLVRRFLAEGEPGLTPRSRRPAVASTGVKNPDYSDAMYITELVVADTVNAMPEKTLLAFADHGEAEGDKVIGTAAQAQEVFDALECVGMATPGH